MRNRAPGPRTCCWHGGRHGGSASSEQKYGSSWGVGWIVWALGVNRRSEFAGNPATPLSSAEQPIACCCFVTFLVVAVLGLLSFKSLGIDEAGLISNGLTGSVGEEVYVGPHRYFIGFYSSFIKFGASLERRFFFFFFFFFFFGGGFGISRFPPHHLIAHTVGVRRSAA